MTSEQLKSQFIADTAVKILTMTRFYGWFIWFSSDKSYLNATCVRCAKDVASELERQNVAPWQVADK